MSHPMTVDSLNEVSGYFVSSIIEIMLSEDLQPLLADYCFDCLHLETWYPQAFFLDMLNFVLDVIDESQINLTPSDFLVELGRRIIASSILPPMMTLEEGLQGIAKIYALNHRCHYDYEGIIVEQVAEGHLQVTNATPYPDALIVGYIDAIIQRSPKSERHATLQYAEPLTVIDGTQYTVFDIHY